MSFRRIAGPAGFPLVLLVVIPALRCSPGSESDDAKSASGTQPAATSRPAGAWHPPTPLATEERAEERRRMVETQIARPRDGRQVVTDERVLAAMRAVPRHVFVPQSQRRLAYADHPLPIGHDQTISQPYIVAIMTEQLELTPETKVLEIGTGSGYQAAVLAHLTPHVYTIEIVRTLAERAKGDLGRQGYHDVRCRAGDGYLGWPEAAPFDAIIVTCAPDHLPEPLWEQLRTGGRIVIPISEPRGFERLVVVTKTPDGQREMKTVMGVRFVPMTREK